MTRLLLGTRNPGKLRELRALLDGLALELVTPDDLGLSLEVDESGSDYAENAARKAQAYAAAAGLPALADDSGLEVEALGGAPGLHSARLLPGRMGKAPADDAARRARLLELLAGKPRPWRARFRCAAVVALPAGERAAAEGTCTGEIVPAPRGAGGFGYDPLFLVDGQGLTMAELPEAVKNRLSHRARALQALRPALERLARGEPPRSGPAGQGRASHGGAAGQDDAGIGRRGRRGRQTRG